MSARVFDVMFSNYVQETQAKMIRFPGHTASVGDISWASITLRYRVESCTNILCHVMTFNREPGDSHDNNIIKLYDDM